MQLRHGLIVVCLGLSERYLQISGIEIHERLPRLHRLIVFNVNSGDGTLNPGSDRIQVGVDLCIIRRFVGAGMNPPGNAAEDKKQSNHSADEDGAPPLSWIDRRLFADALASDSDVESDLFGACCSSCFASVCGDMMYPFLSRRSHYELLEKIWNGLFGQADCACILDSSDIERKEAVDVVQFGRSQAFLRLDDLDGCGDTGGKAVLRLLEGAECKLPVAVRNLHLLRGHLQDPGWRCGYRFRQLPFGPRAPPCVETTAASACCTWDLVRPLDQMGTFRLAEA